MFNLKRITDAKFMSLILQGKSTIGFNTGFSSVYSGTTFNGRAIKREFPSKAFNCFNRHYFLEGDKARDKINIKKLNVKSFEKHHFSQKDEDSNSNDEKAYGTKNQQFSHPKSKTRNETCTQAKSANEENKSNQKKRAEKGSSKTENGEIGKAAPFKTNADSNKNASIKNEEKKRSFKKEENFNFLNEENKNAASNEVSMTQFKGTKLPLQEDPIECLKAEMEKLKNKMKEEREQNKKEREQNKKEREQNKKEREQDKKEKNEIKGRLNIVEKENDEMKGRLTIVERKLFVLHNRQYLELFASYNLKQILACKKLNDDLGKLKEKLYSEGEKPPFSLIIEFIFSTFLIIKNKGRPVEEYGFPQEMENNLKRIIDKETETFTKAEIVFKKLWKDSSNKIHFKSKYAKKYLKSMKTNIVDRALLDILEEFDHWKIPFKSFNIDTKTDQDK